MNANDSLVTVITPVYNGEPYLHDCIQSVLNQTYRNIHYVIVDNCSNDRSLKIADEAAAADSRVTVVRNDEHVGVIQNWNRSLGAVDDHSKYVKFVHADDWLFPTCVTRMVEVAEADDKVALVSAYRLEENRVTLDHLPADAPLDAGVDWFSMNGRSVASAILLERASVLGSPSSLLMRKKSLGDLVKFYDTSFLHADKEAALRIFREHDFGFVRQVLVFTRRHNESVTSSNYTLDTRRQENLMLLRNYGSEFLTEEEFRWAWERELRDYYNFLAANVATGQSAIFWDSHAKSLRRAGEALSRSRLTGAFLRRWLNPGMALKEFRQRRSGIPGRGHGVLHDLLSNPKSNHADHVSPKVRNSGSEK